MNPILINLHGLVECYLSRWQPCKRRDFIVHLDEVLTQCVL